MANLQNTGRTLVDTVSPTSSDINYTYKSIKYPIRECTFWYNSSLGQMFMCTQNDGLTAVWKEFGLT